MRKREFDTEELTMRKGSWLIMEKKIGTSSQIWHRMRQKDMLMLYTEVSSVSKPFIRKLKTVPGNRRRKLLLN